MCFTDRLRGRQAVQIAGFERRNVGQTGWTVGVAAVCNPAKFHVHRCYTRCGESPSTYMLHMLRFSEEQQCAPRQCSRVAEMQHFRFRCLVDAGTIEKLLAIQIDLNLNS